MDNNFFVRRIDSLGRIVIPKDLRNKIKINLEDQVDIIYKQDHLEIYKHQANSVINKVQGLVNIIKDIINFDIYVANFKYLLNDVSMELPDDLLKFIKEKREYYSFVSEEIHFGNKVLKGYFAFIPMIVNSEMIGLLILRKDSPFDDVDKMKLNFIKSFVYNINLLC